MRARVGRLTKRVRLSTGSTKGRKVAERARPVTRRWRGGRPFIAIDSGTARNPNAKVRSIAVLDGNNESLR
jgi:hypothetical protein